MQRQFNHTGHRTIGIIALSAALLVAVVCAASAKVLLRDSPNAQPSATYELSGSSASPELSGSAPQERVKVELITLRPEGFDPAELDRPAEPFMLAVDNFSEQETISLRLEGEGNTLIYEVLLPRERNDWHQLVDLPAGAYTLREANHPDWLCQITLR